MPTPPPTSDLAAIRQAVKDEVAPLAAEVVKLQTKMDGLDTRYYPRETMDQMLKAIHSDVDEMRDMLRTQSDRLRNTLLMASVVAGLILMFYQHVSLH